MLGQTRTLINSILSRFSKCFITVEIVPSYLPKLWPPKHGLKAKSSSGGSLNPYLKNKQIQRTILLSKATQDSSRRLWGQVGAVDYTSALQVGKGYSRVAVQLQKFNPLFTLDFTQITVMQFYSIREYSQKVRVTLSRKFLILFSLTV